MRQYPTYPQFSRHACTHWEMRPEEGEYCIEYEMSLDDRRLACEPRCPRYEPQSLTLDELLAEILAEGEREMSDVVKEMRQAVARGEQPRCFSCGAPLDVVEVQSITLRWAWNPAKAAYVKSESEGVSDKPECVACGVKCWEFTGNGIIEY